MVLRYLESREEARMESNEAANVNQRGLKLQVSIKNKMLGWRPFGLGNKGCLKWVKE